MRNAVRRLAAADGPQCRWPDRTRRLVAGAADRRRRRSGPGRRSWRAGRLDPFADALERHLGDLRLAIQGSANGGRQRQTSERPRPPGSPAGGQRGKNRGGGRRRPAATGGRAPCGAAGRAIVEGRGAPPPRRPARPAPRVFRRNRRAGPTARRAPRPPPPSSKLPSRGPPGKRPEHVGHDEHGDGADDQQPDPRPACRRCRSRRRRSCSGCCRRRSSRRRSIRPPE